MDLLRRALIVLSQNAVLQQSMVRIPVFRRAARRFVAGETLQDAIRAIQALNAVGLKAALDFLGENVTDQLTAMSASGEYLHALVAIEDARVHCNISVKLTQLGLDVDDDFCYWNAWRVARKAADFGNFMRIDMEGTAYTERTLAIYRRLRREFDNIGIAIQSYLYRSEADVAQLIGDGIGHFRLCKGAYDEPAIIAYQRRDGVTKALNGLIAACLSTRALAHGTYCAVASHDEEVINFTRAYAYQRRVPSSSFEFQMLYGIQRELQAELVHRGYHVRVYVPYGTHWYPYFMRRLAERPANLTFFLRALTGN